MAKKKKVDMNNNLDVDPRDRASLENLGLSVNTKNIKALEKLKMHVDRQIKNQWQAVYRNTGACPFCGKARD